MLVLLYLWDSGIPGFSDSAIPEISFFLSSTFVYEPILSKVSMNANIVKTQIFHKIKWQTMTFLFKINFFFCLCYWLIEGTNDAEHYERAKFDLYKDDIFPILTFTYVLMDNFLSLFLLLLCTYYLDIRNLLYCFLMMVKKDIL